MTSPSKPNPLGREGSVIRRKGQVENYYKLRKEHLKNGTLFEDPEFPADDSSIYFSGEKTNYEWRRPKEICANPKLYVEGISRFDINQGNLGDCWQVASLASLTRHKDLVHQVFPKGQGFGENYAGIFHFRFWQFGRWVDIIIDDRLPYNPDVEDLAFLKSVSRNEFWTPLLEKAYAKLYGSFEAIVGGNASEAMQDFTGGVTEIFRSDAVPEDFFNILLQAHQRYSLMGCSVKNNPEKGLLGGHVYTITDLKLVQRKLSPIKIRLIRLRNPWGRKEWTGAFSDSSKEWNDIPEKEKQALGLTVKDDGEFWMLFEEFRATFEDIEICNLGPECLTEDINPNKRWQVHYIDGQWVKGISAGGNSYVADKFCRNPQYRVTLTVPDDECDGKCTLLLALMQKHRRAQRHVGLDDLPIGFEIYRLSDPDNAPKPLDPVFLRANRSLIRPMVCSFYRELTRRLKLSPGTYCIVPYVYECDKDGEFLLRIFTEKENKIEINDQEVGYDEGSVAPEVRSKRATPKEDRDAVDSSKLFRQNAGDRLELGWAQLQKIFEINAGVRFSKELCRSFVAMLDADRSGKLGLEEFTSLWDDVGNWKTVFGQYDKDGSGALNTSELRNALNSSGYRVNFNTLNVLVRRYADENGELELDDFILCAVKLRTIIDIFKEKDPGNTNNATFTLDEWMEYTIYT